MPEHLEVTVSGGGDAYVAGRDIHIVTSSHPVRHSRGTGECPYPGLEPFDASSAVWFHGRGRAVAELCRRLDAQLQRGGPLVLLGPSGAGKSSLLAAGVLPALADGALPARGSSHWRQLMLTPTASPAKVLAHAFGASAADWREDAERCAADILRSVVGSGLVLVVDQFEEVFTLVTDEAERLWFIEVLDRLARPRDANVLVVLGVRADFYARCTADERLRAALRDDPVLLDPMTEAELEQAVRCPAEAVGLAVEDGLVELLLAELGGPGTLPLLAHALRATWQEREDGVLTAAGYRLSGGVHGAVTRTAESAYAGLTPEGRRAARIVFLRLVVIGRDTEDTRRHVPRHELVNTLPDDLADGGPGELPAEAVITSYTRHRLLTTDQDTVTIAHEALIRGWPRLRGWIERDRADHLVRQDLEQAAAAWERGGSELFTGARLETAANWAVLHPADLTPTARAFLAAAHRQQRRSRQLRRAVLATVTALALLATTTAVLGYRQSRQARAATERTITSQLSALAAEFAPTDPALAAQLALAAYRRAPNEDTAARLVNFENTPIPTELTPPGTAVTQTAFDPRGRLLATALADGLVQLWDVQDPHRARLLHQLLPTSPGPVSALRFSPDGQLLAAGTPGGVGLWRVADPDRPTPVQPPIRAPGKVAEVLFSPDGHTLTAIGETTGPAGLVTRWDVTAPEKPTRLGKGLLRELGPFTSAVYGMDGRILVTGSSSGAAELWDVTDPTDPARPLSAISTAGQVLAVDSAQGVLVTGREHDELQFWDIRNPRAPHTVLDSRPLSGRTGAIRSAAFGRENSLLAVAHGNGVTSLWNMAQPYNPSLLGELPTRSSVAAGSVAFSPDGSTLAVIDELRSVTLWSLPPTLLASGGPVVFSRDGQTLATSDGMSYAQLWDVARPSRPTKLGTAEIGAGAPRALAFSQDGQTLALGAGVVGGTGGAVWLADISDPRHPAPLGPPLPGSAAARALAFSPDRRTLAVGDDAGTLHLWRVDDPRAATPLGSPQTDPPNALVAVAFSHDGSTLATARDRAIQLWSIDEPGRAVRLGPPMTGSGSVLGAVTSIAYSQDSQTLASGHWDGTVRLWDLREPRTPSPLGAPLTGPSGSVNAVAFSPDGRTLAAGGGDGTVHLWTLGSAEGPVHLSRPLTGPSGAVDSLSFNPDGHTLAVSSVDAAVRLWDLDVEAAVARICATSEGVLTAPQWARLVPNAPLPQLCVSPRSSASPPSR
ncbi:WD40 repeat domain-containing protein [Kitasatospora xanthocidica]|uniref:WD40 repeat domain-containing protein n=1 Tax=Kitasatospora xanthocidica TaxID=83382 RepID=UPI0016748ED2|nr:WD40 repeat domain-containing protein [Kitasatospora xanthocidica]